MPTRWDTFSVQFDGGLVTNSGLLEQALSQPGSATKLTNFEPSVEGGYKKILGYSKWIENAVPDTGQIYGVVVADERDAIAVRNNKFFKSTDKSNWVEKLDLSANPPANFVRHDEFNFDGTKKIMMVDGVNFPVVWEQSGDTISEVAAGFADTQASSFVTVFKNHVFLAKNNILTFSSPFDETDYDPANGAGNINVGTEVTGIIVFRDDLIVFGRDSIKRISGSSSADFILSPIATKTGCIDGNSIQEVGGDIMYLGPDGVRFLSATERIGDFALNRASENIQKDILTFSRNSGTFSSTVIRGKNQYRLFRYIPGDSRVSSSGFLATRFIDRQATGISWSSLRGFKIYTVNSKQYDDNEVILFSSDDNHIYEMESATSFDGNDIECRFQTPFLPLTDPRIRKTVFKISAYVKPEGLMNLNTSVLLDYGEEEIIQPAPFTLVQGSDNFTVYGAATYGTSKYGKVLRKVYVKNVNGSGFVFSFNFQESSTNPPFNLTSLLVEYSEYERR